ncbi:response regulator transcription factor [Actinophytocola sediminis]
MASDELAAGDPPRHPSLASSTLADGHLPDGIRVLVVGDDVLARRGVLAALDGEPGMVIVGEHGAGPEVVTSLTHRHPDVLLLHGLRTEDAAPLLTSVGDTVRRSGRTVRVLGIGVRDGDPLTVPAGNGQLPSDLTGIVSGSLPAWATPEEMVAAVRIAAAGFTLSRADQADHRPPPGQPPRGRQVAARAGLSERECDVLALVARGLSNAEIAESLSVSEHTVKSHMQNLLGKLRLRNRIHAVIYAFETGLASTDGTAQH